MIYLSQGIVQKGSNEQLLQVLHCGQIYELTENDAAIWLNGRFSFETAEEPNELIALEHLKNRGLVEAEQEHDAYAQYQIATRCIFCPADRKPHIPLATIDSFLLMWMRNAGLHLTVAELIYLYENNIHPCPELCYERNRQKLVERIYTVDTIADNILENQMAQMPSRDKVVASLMRLLRKKRVLVL